MSVESNKAAVHAYFKAIDDAQSMAPLDSLVSPSYVAHFPGASHMDRASTQGFGNGFFQACPGLRHEVDELIADGDRVAARLRIHGTQSQPLVTPTGAIPPSGKAFELLTMNLFRFESGKVVEQYSYFDMLGFLQQIGAMPSPQAA